jgi:Zn ribbon nucleic-acid-binding protein
MKRNTLITILAVFFVLALTLRPAFAQIEAYELVFRREWGVGLPGQVQGRMSLTLKGDLDAVAHVQYIMDEQEMASVTAPTLKFEFNTDDFEPGTHTFYANVSTKDGKNHQTPTFSVNFMAAGEAGKFTRNLFIGIGALMLLVALLSFFLAKRQRDAMKAKGVSTNGLRGAAVCPKCSQAFTRSIWGINLVAKRYERCPHCGNWSITQRATQAEIDVAEARLKADLGSDMSSAEDLASPSKSDELNESKYTEL